MRNPYLSLLKTAWKHAQEKRQRFILIYGLFLLANLVVALNPLFYGWFISEVQKKGAAVIDTAWIYAGGFILLRLVEWGFHGPARIMERQLAFHISKNFIDGLYNKVLHLPVDWHQDHHSGSTISKLRKGYDALRDFFQQGFVYFYSIGKFTFSFGAMLYFSPLFGFIGVILGFITVLIIIQYDKPFIRSLKEVNLREHEVSSNLFDSLSNIRTVITLKLEKRIHHALLDKISAVFPPFKRNITINELKWFTAQMMVALIYAVTVFGYIYQHWVPGEIFQVAGLIILIGYVNQFTSVFNDIAGQYTQIVKFDTELQNVRELEQAFAATVRNPVTAIPKEWSKIEISKLNYLRKQTDPEKPAAGLIDFSMQIKKGQRIALIGESGSGKSTLLSLLRGLHTPFPGSVTTLDNTLTDFERITTDVTLLPQDPEIFENTILYNITLGHSFTDEEIWMACEQAQFAEVVKALPAGLHTHIQEKGVNLSGGQKQRLALARGFLAARNSAIVLLDEPTSSVDPATEKKIYNTLFETFADKSIVSSLHRLHLLPAFDYIYIMKDGSVIDEGSFDNLEKYSLVFKEMWEHQRTYSETMQYPQLNVAL